VAAPTLSPDGHWVEFVSLVGTRTIDPHWLMIGPLDSAAQPLLDTGGNYYLTGWSPDSQYFYIVLAVNGVLTLKVLQPDGTSVFETTLPENIYSNTDSLVWTQCD
jgi:Tol biopolymer transport system component